MKWEREVVNTGDENEPEEENEDKVAHVGLGRRKTEASNLIGLLCVNKRLVER